jgi:hypothetical protein
MSSLPKVVHDNPNKANNYIAIASILFGLYRVCPSIIEIYSIPNTHYCFGPPAASPIMFPLLFGSLIIISGFMLLMYRPIFFTLYNIYGRGSILLYVIDMIYYSFDPSAFNEFLQELIIGIMVLIYFNDAVILNHYNYIVDKKKIRKIYLYCFAFVIIPYFLFYFAHF